MKELPPPSASFRTNYFSSVHFIRHRNTFWRWTLVRFYFHVHLLKLSDGPRELLGILQPRTFLFAWLYSSTFCYPSTRCIENKHSGYSYSCDEVSRTPSRGGSKTRRNFIKVEVAASSAVVRARIGNGRGSKSARRPSGTDPRASSRRASDRPIGTDRSRYRRAALAWSRPPAVVVPLDQHPEPSQNLPYARALSRIRILWT